MGGESTYFLGCRTDRCNGAREPPTAEGTRSSPERTAAKGVLSGRGPRRLAGPRDQRSALPGLQVPFPAASGTDEPTTTSVMGTGQTHRHRTVEPGHVGQRRRLRLRRAGTPPRDGAREGAWDRGPGGGPAGRLRLGVTETDESHTRVPTPCGGCVIGLCLLIYLHHLQPETNLFRLQGSGRAHSYPGKFLPS